MFKINQIEQALLSLGGGEFQKLADAFLVEKEFGRLNSIGSVAGANKVRRGTPDALFVSPEGRYTFAEHTTQKLDLLSKMKGDLEKCLDEGKTGIPVESIDRVVFCFTGKLSTEDEYELREICQSSGVALDLFGIHALASELYSKYPGLALDYLGVSIDTGQIVSLERFVSLYGNSRLATRLDHGFHFRTSDLDQSLEALENKNLVILSGRAGVGKSRLALEACRQFKNIHPDYEVACVLGRDRDLWEDLQTQFRRPGKFLVFVDDANRLTKFGYIIDLILHSGEDQEIKVVATVRDYARSVVLDAARSLEMPAEVVVDKFTDDQIKAFVTHEYEIRNHLYLERIVEIACGNPRLAVMAAEIAKDQNTLSSINDVSSLYDMYFSSMWEDLKDEDVNLENSNLLKVATIVSFLNTVDRTSEEIMTSIQDAFGIKPEEFWQTALLLHKREVIDIYEDEIVRISDQVFGTYLFHQAVFRARSVDFGVLLDRFFPSHRDRLVDSINPVLSAFDNEVVLAVIRLGVEPAWSKLELESDAEGLLQLINTFWFTQPTKTLCWVQERIEEIEPELVDASQVLFEKAMVAAPSPSILSVLTNFATATVDDARMGINLLLQYLVKRPSEVPFVLSALLEEFGFKAESYSNGFVVQRTVIDELWQFAQQKGIFFSRLFLAVASDYLQTHFSSSRMKGARQIQFLNFDLPPTEALFDLRGAIWGRVIGLYEVEDLQVEVMDIVGKYCSPSYRLASSECLKRDAELVLPFLESVSNPNKYQDCLLMHSYIDVLEGCGKAPEEGLVERFRCETFSLAEVLLSEWGQGHAQDLPYEDYKRFKRDRLDKYLKDYSLDNYVRLFESCSEILKVGADKKLGNYQLREGLEVVLDILADNDGLLFVRVMEFYLGLGDPFGICSCTLVQRVVDQLGLDQALRFLQKANESKRRRWLFYLQEVISTDAANELWLSRLWTLYETEDVYDLPHGFDYLLKYLSLDSKIVAKVTGIVLQKAEAVPEFARPLTMLFNPLTDVFAQLPDLFSEDINLLKKAYFAAEAGGHFSDYRGEAFSCILELDGAFIEEYIAWKFQNSSGRMLGGHDGRRDYSFIWERSDYQEVMDKVVDEICENERNLLFTFDPYLRAFFQTSVSVDNTNEEVVKRQNAFMLHQIDKAADNADLMVYLFGCISKFSENRRLLFVERFIQGNNRFAEFKRLPLEPSTRSYSGSAVPMLQEEVGFWESLLPIMNTVELLFHKQYIEQKVEALHAEIEWEKKANFAVD